MRKKAISPLIATILLIAVAVVIAGMLMSWGQNFVQKGIQDADQSIDKKCTGAAIGFIRCDYNSSGNIINFSMVNSGDVIFKQDTNFNVLLIDSNNSLVNTNLGVLDGAGLDTGEAASVTISDYTGISPIRLEVRNTQCPGYFWPTTCK